MTNSEVKVTENSAEILVCSKWDKMHHECMNKDLSEVFIKCRMIDSTPKSAKDPEFRFEVLKEVFLATMMDNRCQCYQFTLSTAALLFLTECTQNPGSAVIILTLIQKYVYLHPNLKDTELDMKVLSNIFPIGFPTMDQFKELWDSQKILARPDNALDYQLSYKSITL